MFHGEEWFRKLDESKGYKLYLFMLEETFILHEGNQLSKFTYQNSDMYSNLALRLHTLEPLYSELVEEKNASLPIIGYSLLPILKQSYLVGIVIQNYLPGIFISQVRENDAFSYTQALSAEKEEIS